MEEEHSGEDGYFGEMEKVNKSNVQVRLKELKSEEDVEEELNVLKRYVDLLAKQTTTNKQIKNAEAQLDKKLFTKYPQLTVEEIKTLVVDDKWMQTIQTSIDNEIDHISQHLSNRIEELAERYESPLPTIDKEVADLESKVSAHLERMGFVWNN
ncbi:hypothetical protein ES705_46480 [subsurface metagenome]